MIKSADVAERAGVSRATVSQILNGRDARFSEETKQRVRQAAVDLGYQPSLAARTLARGSSDVVIALIPNTTFGDNLQDLFEGMTEELAEHGLTLVLRLATPTTSSLDRLVSTLRPAAVHALTPFTSAERELLTERGVATVDPSTQGHADYNEAIGSLQARTLIDRGHTRLAFAHLHDARQDPFGTARERGVRDRCREAGLPDPTVLRIGIDIDEAAAALDELGSPGFAVACYNDDVATALLSAATLRGWRVPEDLALIGMDHTPLGQVTVPPLTTISYDRAATARSSTAHVLAVLGLRDPENTPAPPEFTIVPGSTA
ncbi:LacI family DNA-binding transcriptional regulator [Nocardioides sp. NPDC101246]|uniref:LacI family DNA-binding transcriptional regulator n=1 Tax=Nocardioides sp. NPDC101246 TaxID=3364336 RepID=UPI00380A0FAB